MIVRCEYLQVPYGYYLKGYLEIFWSDHHVEPDGSVITEHLICPASDGSDELDGSNTIVSDEDALYGSFATELMNKFSW